MPKRWLVKKEMACCVRGYHVYKDIWAATIGDVSLLVCRCRKNFVVQLCSASAEAPGSPISFHSRLLKKVH